MDSLTYRLLTIEVVEKGEFELFEGLFRQIYAYVGL